MQTPRNVIEALKKHTGSFYPIVSFDERKDKLLLLDFTAANTELTNEVLGNTNLFTQYIDKKLQKAGARYGIGGYSEHRTIYDRSPIFAGANPRSLHLGTDIWGAPHAHVASPLDGIVHSFGFHPLLGDYGAVIILAHLLEGVSFFTLYGHLSLGSIKNLREGQRIAGGDVFAEFGIPQENGWWPPHLHFQIIQDMQGWKSDYPGVCALNEKEAWLQNCPDPDLLLNLNQYLK